MNNINKRSEPFYPIHPGEILKDEIEYRGISQRKLASQLGISHSLLNEILNAKRQINTEFALLMEAALNLDAEMLVNMQTRYNIQTARQDVDKQNRLNEIRKICASLF